MIPTHQTGDPTATQHLAGASESRPGMQLAEPDAAPHPPAHQLLAASIASDTIIANRCGSSVCNFGVDWGVGKLDSPKAIVSGDVELEPLGGGSPNP